MSDDFAKLEELFDAGSDLEQARAFLIKAHCKDNHWLQEELESLWEHSQDEDSSFDFDAILDFGKTNDQPTEGDALPKAANAYEILDSIASGGMGTVYKAQQQHPIKRLVALKTLNTGGPVSQEHLMRFQIEQSVLAMMKHNYIASVFDSGVTSEGLPFYTMEFLDGLPITEYCDHHQLNIRERLLLFRKVCEGIQHAHQKGVIHRDLKPSNVLVIEQEGEAVPKIIDFGIAKLTDDGAFQNTHQTRVGIVMGTPDYMSPEQAAGADPQRIDTRTDIYSLGVMLYEILAGLTPLGHLIRQAGSIKDACLVIMNEDPKAPSKRIGNDSEAIAAERGSSPNGLRHTLREDLDWIALKALEREPNLRYATCAEFAADITHYLEDRPVSASPPGKVYHFKKFMRRYRRQVLSAAVILLAVIAATAAFIAQQATANRQIRKEVTKQQAVTDFMTNMFISIHPGVSGKEVKVFDMLQQSQESISSKLADQPDLQALLWYNLGSSYSSLNIFEKSQESFEKALKLLNEVDKPDIKLKVRVLRGKAHLLLTWGRTQEAFTAADAAFQLASRYFGPNHRETLISMHHLGEAYKFNHQLEEAKATLKECTSRMEISLEEDDVELMMARITEAELYNTQEATDLFEKEVARLEKKLGKNNPRLISAKINLSTQLKRQGQLKRAESYQREFLSEFQEVFGEKHIISINLMSSLADTLFRQGRYDEAVERLDKAYGIGSKHLGSYHQEVLRSASLLLYIHYLTNKSASNLDLSAYEYVSDPQEKYNPAVIMLRINLANNLLIDGDYQGCELITEDLLSYIDQVFSTSEVSYRSTYMTMGEVLVKMKNHQKALPYLYYSAALFSQYDSSGVDYCLILDLIDICEKGSI